MALYPLQGLLPRYYDGEQYIVHFWEDDLRIDSLHASLLKIDPTLQQVHTPSIILRHLGGRFWAHALASLHVTG